MCVCHMHYPSNSSRKNPTAHTLRNFDCFFFIERMAETRCPYVCEMRSEK